MVTKIIKTQAQLDKLEEIKAGYSLQELEGMLPELPKNVIKVWS